MAQLINTIKDVSHNYKKYDRWEQAQADKMAQKKYLAQNGVVSADQIELTKKKAQAVIRATEIMDTRSENNCENVEQIVGMFAAVPSIGIAMAQTPLTIALENRIIKKDKTLQTLKEELKTATKESQDKINNEIGNRIKKDSMKANRIGMFGTIAGMFAATIGMLLWGNAQQKQASRIGRFQAKQNELKDVENFINYTPEQLEEAEKIAQNIPNKKEKNGFLQSIQEVKEMLQSKKAYKHWAKQKDPNELEKLKARDISPENLKKAKVEQELITNVVSEINIKAEEFSENLENAFDTFGTLSFLLAVPLGFATNKILNIAKANPKIKTVVSYLVPSLTTLGIQLVGTNEQKNASRIGRYYARKDLMENPHKLIYFSEIIENYKELKKEIVEPTYSETDSEIVAKLLNKHYKENTQKHNEKLQEAFKQIESTDAQKAEAKNLQTNVFKAFDEVDEMSQRYSEDIEATTEIAKEAVLNLFQLGWLGGTALLAVGIMKGKISLIKPTRWVNNLALDSKSNIRTSINQILDNLAKLNKQERTQFQQVLISDHKKLGALLEKPIYSDTKASLAKLNDEINIILDNGFEKITNEGNKKQANEILKELSNKHFKQTKTAKWARNMLIEIFKLKTVSNANKRGIPLSKETKEQLGLSGIKNYKTLAWTAGIAGIPILVPLFAVPYMFNSWLTDIQKKAGKIGVMKAMQNLDDPKIFAN